MAVELAAPPPRRRRLGAALGGVGVYVLVVLTAAVLPSPLGNWSPLIGVIAGILVAGGLTPALTIRDWVVAGILTLALGVILSIGFSWIFLIWTWTPDIPVR